MLSCPGCHSDLSWNIDGRQGNRIQDGESRCQDCGAVYPVREGIGVFLTAELSRVDLWEQTESKLTNYLAEHPEIEGQLLEQPLADLAPTDQHIRAQILEARGLFTESKVAREAAWQGLYTEDHRACATAQVRWACAHLGQCDDPIVDIASGLGHLVDKLVQETDKVIVATDFSPRVLRRQLRELQFLGLDDRVDHLAFDARRTPFKDQSVPNISTFMGLGNIMNPMDLLGELHRITRGSFVAVCNFCREDDDENRAALRSFGLEDLGTRESAVSLFRRAGWKVEVMNLMTGHAVPTPESKLIAGLRVDGLPVAETDLEWCVLVASHAHA